MYRFFLITVKINQMVGLIMDRVRVDKQKIKGTSMYFESESDVESTSKLSFIDTGSTLLNLVLGGGWPLGRISNVIGNFSTGKCVEDGYVLGKNGLKLLSTYQSDVETSPDQNEQLTSFEMPLAISKNKKDTTSHFYKTYTDQVVRFRTKNGYQLTATPEHPIAIFNEDCQIVLLRSDELQVGDYAVLAKDTQCFSKTNAIIDSPFYKGPINPKLAELFGLLSFIRWGNEKHLIEQAVVTAEQSLLLYKINRHLERFDVKMDVIFNINNTPFTDFLKNHLTKTIKGEEQCVIPDAVLQSTKPIHLAFLRGFLFYKLQSFNKSFSIFCNTTQHPNDDVLHQQLLLLLLNIGIFVNHTDVYSEEGENKYKLTIGGSSCKALFKQLFNIDLHIDDDETIPFLAKTLKELDVSYLKNHHDDLTYEELNRFLDQNQDFEFYTDLKGLYDSGYVFDPIVFAETVQLEEKIPVFDVTVPKSHLFWCNGFVNHNTLLAIESSANFHRQYPNGIIKYLETESAFDTDYAQALGMPIEHIDFVGDKFADFTVESLYEDLTATIPKLKTAGTPCLYIVDSLDALSDRAERERTIDKGSYGANKAKILSELFRRCVADIQESKIHLQIVSQIRDNIGVMIGEKTTRTGGRALDFYASHIVNLSQISKITKTIRKQERVCGINIKARCKKNKVSIPHRECVFPIIFNYGIDDILSMFTWLASIGKEEIVKELVESNYRTLADASNKIKSMDAKEYQDKLTNLKKTVILLWNELENEFAPKIKKYQ